MPLKNNEIVNDRRIIGIPVSDSPDEVFKHEISYDDVKKQFGFDFVKRKVLQNDIVLVNSVANINAIEISGLESGLYEIRGSFYMFPDQTFSAGVNFSLNSSQGVIVNNNSIFQSLITPGTIYQFGILENQGEVEPSVFTPFWGLIEISTIGNVFLTVAQDFANANPIRIYKGSWLEVRKMI